MNRTQRLMASVAAAVALSGSKSAQVTVEAATQDRGAQAPTDEKQPKTASAESQAAEAVFSKVDVFLQSKGLSLDDLQKRLPSMDPKTILAMLDRLIYEGKLRRIGEGTPDAPYRYYRYRGGGG